MSERLYVPVASINHVDTIGFEGGQKTKTFLLRKTKLT